ncbi:hypothetical protein KXW96_004761 [Aspergillus fumigatus]|nr:hypothetical protein KXW96_004761 [Aspergillus fumigatus]
MRVEGATAILDYHTIQSPLAQPRSSILGHVLGAVVGVGVTKLFKLRSDFEDLRWVAGAVCTAVASLVMGLTNTVHPPGGATALLAAVDSTVDAMGWFFVPLVLIGSLLMLGCALVVNNIQRQFPMFWWTPRDVVRKTGPPDIEKASEVPQESRERRISWAVGVLRANSIVISPDRVVIPDGFTLGLEEKGILEVLRDRLRDPDQCTPPKLVANKSRRLPSVTKLVPAIFNSVGNSPSMQGLRIGLAGLAGLLATASVCLSAPADQNITSDTYFYGQSPPVYPSPEGTGTGSWAAAYAKAKKFVAQLTPEEKVNLTAGTDANNGCSGNIAAIPRLNFPGLCVSDAGNGLRGTDYVSSWPSGLHVGASWNKALARQRAVQMATEFRKKGVNVLLGPVVGPLGRVAEAGRNWEGFSNDPYLSGALVYETVDGAQSVGVATCTKHYILNEQETNRNPGMEDGVEVAAVSSNIDDKTMHELYLWPFQDAVLAGSASIMCSYNRVNNSYGCQNSKTLNGLLKTELGFQGYVMTDWGAQHAGIAGANAGLDMVMPSTETWGANLTTAISNGTMDASRLDDMATRIIASWYQMNQDSDFPSPGAGMPSDMYAPHQRVIGRDASSKQTLLRGAIEGHVLVKNNHSALPLKSPQLLSVFGYDAKGPNALKQNFNWLSYSPAIQENHTLWVGGGSGANNAAYIDAPIDAIQRQAYEDGTSVLYDISSEDPEVDPTTDACLVFINSYATEGWDRPGLADNSSDTLVKNVARKCANTIVTIHNAGIRVVGEWIDHENVTAVIFAHLPGQDSGRALVELLYGRANPSGKLPYTVAKKAEDYGSLLHPSLPETPYGLFPQSDFDEGVYIDYRAFDRANITAQFEFGFGLSYTSFDYSGLQISNPKQSPQYPPSAAIQQGGNPHLWDNIVTVSAEIKNTGRVAGAEVAQLYIGIPNGPVRQLRGFEKVDVSAGETTQVQFALNRRDLSTWDVEAQQWSLQRGTYRVYVGRSSRDLPLTGSFTL